MQSQLRKRDLHPFGFDLRPVFNAYIAQVKYSELPTPSGIIDLYDEIIKMNLDSIDNKLFLEDFKHYKKPLSEHISEMSLQEINSINKELNMKITLLIPELVVILKFYNVFYKDEHGQCFNIPIKEVWR